MKQKDLIKMLQYRRPENSRTEREFINRYIDSVPGMSVDNYGNRILVTGPSKTMIACHTDTVHRFDGKQAVEVIDGVARVPARSMSNCLGADDTAGVYAALRMIEAGVKATFVFHRAEEIGGCGSQWLAYNYPDWISSFSLCLSLDRRGTRDIITHQFGKRTASDLFAWSLADALDMDHRPTEGIFTDSANYEHLIPECSNISIGYQAEHTQFEQLDLNYLERVIGRLCEVKWDSLEIARGTDDEDLEFEFEMETEEEYRLRLMNDELEMMLQEGSRDAY